MFLWEMLWRFGPGERRPKVLFAGKTLDKVMAGKTPNVDPGVLVVVIRLNRVPLVLASTGDGEAMVHCAGESWNLEFVNPGALRKRWFQPYYAGRPLCTLPATDFRVTDVAQPKFVLRERRSAVTQ